MHDCQWCPQFRGIAEVQASKLHRRVHSDCKLPICCGDCTLICWPTHERYSCAAFASPQRNSGKARGPLVSHLGNCICDEANVYRVLCFEHANAEPGCLHARTQQATACSLRILLVRAALQRERFEASTA